MGISIGKAHVTILTNTILKVYLYCCQSIPHGQQLRQSVSRALSQHELTVHCKILPGADPWPPPGGPARTSLLFSQVSIELIRAQVGVSMHQPPRDKEIKSTGSRRRPRSLTGGQGPTSAGCPGYPRSPATSSPRRRIRQPDRAPRPGSNSGSRRVMTTRTGTTKSQ